MRPVPHTLAPAHAVTRRRPSPSPLARLGTPLLALLVGGSLAAAVVGGLLRAGAVTTGLGDRAVVGHAALAHAALMLPGFLGTAIAIERAVAIRRRWAFATPLASGLAGVCLLAGAATTGAALFVLAALAFVVVNAVVVARQRAAHTMLLLVGALALLAGSSLFAAGGGLAAASALPWWFAFPVLTIAAERLEMTRLARRHPASLPTLAACVAALGIGAALGPFAPVAGGAVYGLALMALAAWLGVFDIARRTVRAPGLPRYMALCLLAGYAWLGVAGLAWFGMAFGCPGRDMALHALGLGFIVSMVMGHAPVILPAVAHVKLHFSGWFYLPLTLLHGSLAWRLFGGIGRPEWRSAGAALNAMAIAVFAATAAAAALAWRRRASAPGRDAAP